MFFPWRSGRNLQVKRLCFDPAEIREPAEVLKAGSLLNTCKVLVFSCRLGTEHEKLGYHLDDHRRLDYSEIKFLLEQICLRYGWTPVMEKDKIVGTSLFAACCHCPPNIWLRLCFIGTYFHLRFTIPIVKQHG